jgi:predicted transcriptional regulator
MDRESTDSLSRREAQIMDVAFRLGEASAAQILENLPDPPSYSSVRALLAILERKGHLKHREEEGKYIYSPIKARSAVARRALRRVVQTFFEGSLEKTVVALLQTEDRRLSADELKRIQSLIAHSQNKEKKP